MSDLFQDQLQALRAQSLLRKLREIGSAQGPEIQIVGQQLVNFSSNDYLGLANDARLRKAAIDAIEEFGVGAGASRLISGTQSPHVRLETALAKWKGTPAAVCFSSGYAAAIGTIPALVGKHDVVLLDKLAHASLIDGARLSGAILRVFPHNHLGKLESHLEWAQREHPGRRVLVVTESVFSMDGDRAPLRQLIDLKNRFGALLFLDEAHAVGVLGPNGRGLAAEEGLAEEIEVQMGTLSKALGVSGGYICGSRSVIEWLVNRARSFIFSTAPPPALAAASMAAIEFLASAEGEERRQSLWRGIRSLRAALPPNPGLPASSSEGHEAGSAIHPWIVGGEQEAIHLARALQGDGFLVPAIRYPTVAKGSARLRITVTAAHEEAQIHGLCAALVRHAESLRERAAGDYRPPMALARSNGEGTRAGF
ncbi:MAG TPA: 8-amino-7-oxononanoate synthase [Chthoniobacterales bacterium]|nr:8-amino-7-oxononanoate synthase [Chthoniobacterales bacterium]